VNFEFAALSPRHQDTEENNTVLARPCLGIEVTIPSLAAQCLLGNIDPQHTEGRNVAACVEALTCPIPGVGATLVTVRADADSVTAMAVLEARSAGLKVDKEFVYTIGDADGAQEGPWRRDYTPAQDFRDASAVAMNFRSSMEDRVRMILEKITYGVLLPTAPPIDTSEITVYDRGGYAVAIADGLAGRGACSAGYRVAPVVIALNEFFSVGGCAPYKKFTIARWNGSVPMRWSEMLSDLNLVESSSYPTPEVMDEAGEIAIPEGERPALWGGSTSIIGSPQGVDSTLSLSEVEAIVRKHLI
jgi:hypothetical protein